MNIQYLMHTSNSFPSVVLFAKCKRCTFVFIHLQASEKYFQFENEEIVVSIVSPMVAKTVPLIKGNRQTLLIPSAINDEWQLVRYKHKII